MMEADRAAAEDQFVIALDQFLHALGLPRVIQGGRGGLNSRTNLVYAFYLLTAALFYSRFRLLPTDGGHKRELASYVARMLQYRLGYTFELKNGQVVEWHHPFVIDKVGKRIQGQDVVVFSYDKLYSVGVSDRLADDVRRVIEHFQLPVNLEGDITVRPPLAGPFHLGPNDHIGHDGDDDNWLDLLLPP